MRITPTELPGVLIVEPRIFWDNRGHFLETFHGERYCEHGLRENFVQDNLSFSNRGVLRGLHYQIGRPQGKLVMVPDGEIYDVAVDIRVGSPHFGEWAGVRLSSVGCRQIFIPAGFAHGFCVISETASVIYKCTDYYSPADERGIRWDDPGLSIAWPVTDPIMSEKDRLYPTLSEVPAEDLPVYKETTNSEQTEK